MRCFICGFGAVLSQIKNGVEHPCAYASRTLNDTEKKWAPYHLEHLAMVWACRHFRPYISGKHFTLRTDHKPLVSLNKSQTASLDRLYVELQTFLPYTIKYLSGNVMPADGLSRQPQINLVSSIEQQINMNWDQIYHLQTQDKFLKALAIFVKFKQIPNSSLLKEFITKFSNHAVIQNGVLCFKDKFSRLTVFAPTALQSTLLNMAHDDPLSGHYSDIKTFERLQATWFWQNMKFDCTAHCKSCVICQRSNLPSHTRPLPLEPLPISTRFNERVHVDLFGPLPSDHHFKYCMIIVDSYSKLVEAIPLYNKTAEAVGQAFLDRWVCFHGCPNRLISDKGSEFNNQVFQHINAKLGISHQMSTTNHPQSNGQAERQVRNCITYLRKYLDNSPHPNKWIQLLPKFCFSYNSSTHSSTQVTPFFAAYGRHPQMPFDLAQPSQKIHYGSEPHQQQLNQLFLTKNDLIRRQQASFNSQKLQFDKRAKLKQFQLNDKVFILSPHVGDQAQKFQTKYEGPYVIVKLHSSAALVVPYHPSSTAKSRPKLVHFNNMKLSPFLSQFFDPTGNKYLPTSGSNTAANNLTRPSNPSAQIPKPPISRSKKSVRSRRQRILPSNGSPELQSGHSSPRALSPHTPVEDDLPSPAPLSPPSPVLQHAPALPPAQPAPSPPPEPVRATRPYHKYVAPPTDRVTRSSTLAAVGTHQSHHDHPFGSLRNLPFVVPSTKPHIRSPGVSGFDVITALAGRFCSARSPTLPPPSSFSPSC